MKGDFFNLKSTHGLSGPAEALRRPSRAGIRGGRERKSTQWKEGEREAQHMVGAPKIIRSLKEEEGLL